MSQNCHSFLKISRFRADLEVDLFHEIFNLMMKNLVQQLNIVPIKNPFLQIILSKSLQVVRSYKIHEFMWTILITLILGKKSLQETLLNSST